jgi:hypothetical protein
MATPPIFNLFGNSPVKPLQKHMEAVDVCVGELLHFLSAVAQENWPLAETLQLKIVALENEADALKRDLRLHLPKSLFLPVSRSDLLDLLSMQDRLANCARDIAGLMIGRKMVLPDTIKEDSLTFATRCIEATHQAKKAIDELHELFETGFSGTEVHIIEDMIAQLPLIEHDTDLLQIKIRKKLFLVEDSMPPVHVMFLYKIIELLGDIANISQKVGSRLQALLVR